MLPVLLPPAVLPPAVLPPAALPLPVEPVPPVADDPVLPVAPAPEEDEPEPLEDFESSVPLTSTWLLAYFCRSDLLPPSSLKRLIPAIDPDPDMLPVLPVPLVLPVALPVAPPAELPVAPVLELPVELPVEPLVPAAPELEPEPEPILALARMKPPLELDELDDPAPLAAPVEPPDADAESPLCKQPVTVTRWLPPLEL